MYGIGGEGGSSVSSGDGKDKSRSGKHSGRGKRKTISRNTINPTRDNKSKNAKCSNGATKNTTRT